MKVLILSCNTGGGHNSCAQAIGTELQRRGHTYETDDAYAVDDYVLYTYSKMTGAAL